MTLIKPLRNPNKMAAQGSINILAVVPRATPPARVAFCTCAYIITTNT